MLKTGHSPNLHLPSIQLQLIVCETQAPITWFQSRSNLLQILPVSDCYPGNIRQCEPILLPVVGGIHPPHHLGHGTAGEDDPQHTKWAHFSVKAESSLTQLIRLFVLLVIPTNAVQLYSQAVLCSFTHRQCCTVIHTDSTLLGVQAGRAGEKL